MRGVVNNMAAWAFIVIITSVPIIIIAVIIDHPNVAKLWTLAMAIIWAGSITQKPIYDFEGREIIYRNR